MNFQILIYMSFLISNFFLCKTTQELEEDEVLNNVEYKLIDIDQSNYDKYVSSETHFFLLFHNPWCKFSQNLEKKLIYVNKLMKMEQQPYYIGAIDSTLVDSKKIISEKIPKNILNPLLTYPKLVYFYKGVPLEVYRGKHNKHDIYTHMKRKIHPESIKLPIFSIFESKITHDKHAFIFFGEIDKKFELFNNFSASQKEFMFYYTNEDSLYDKLNPKRNATVIHYTFGKKKDSFFNTQNFTLQNWNRFFKKNTFTNFYDKVSEEFINEVVMKNQTAFLLFRNIYDNKTMFLEENIPFIAKGEQTLKFLITDLTGKYDLKLAQLMNVDNQNLPAIRIIDMRNGLKRYEMTREPTMENVLNFIKLWKNKKLQQYDVNGNKQIDPNQKKSLLKKITSNNYYEQVIFHKRNSVLFIYTDWCSHCKKVFPILETVMKKFNPDLVSFYGLELTTNDLEFFEKNKKIKIDKVPLIHLYSIKDKENPIVYPKEEFTFKEIYNFVTQISAGKSEHQRRTDL